VIWDQVPCYHICMYTLDISTYFAQSYHQPPDLISSSVRPPYRSGHK
jgi:hypothetical protein